MSFIPSKSFFTPENLPQEKRYPLIPRNTGKVIIAGRSILKSQCSSGAKTKKRIGFQAAVKVRFFKTDLVVEKPRPFEATKTLSSKRLGDIREVKAMCRIMDKGIMRSRGTWLTFLKHDRRLLDKYKAVFSAGSSRKLSAGVRQHLLNSEIFIQ
jgi:hypothetical protein